MGDKVRGYLSVSVAEASGKNKDDELVWDGNFVEGFVKVEVRGASKNVKVSSAPKRVLANSIQWNETLTIEVLEDAKELRIMLCREKRTGTRVGTSVIAACGIFVNDILEAVPIDKYFELFKPGAGGEGGFIRIGMTFGKERESGAPGGPLSPVAEGRLSSGSVPQGSSFKPQLSMSDYTNDPEMTDKLEKKATPNSAANGGGSAGPADAQQKSEKKGGGGPPVKILLLLGLVGSVATVVIRQRQGK